MSQPTQPTAPAPASPPQDRRVALKDNAGVKHRTPNDKAKPATRGRPSLNAPVPAPEAAHSATTNPAATPGAALTTETAPRAGEKRIRSLSSSSLSTLTPATMGAPPEALEHAAQPSTAANTPRADQEGGQNTVVPYPQPMPTGNPEGEASATCPASDDELEYSPQTPVTPEHRPLTFPPPHMTPTSRNRRPAGSTTPPHLFEPVMHVFHHDTPRFVANPSQATAETMARLQALRSQRTRRCDPQQALTKLVPTPHDGWSRVYPATPDFLYSNIPEATLQKWLSEDSRGKKVIVQVMRQNSWCPPQCDSTANLLARTLNAVYATDKIRVATASEDVRGRSQQNAPFSFLVFGLTSEIATSMVAKHCFASEFIQFLVYPLVYAATPCYIGALGGLRNIGVDNDPSDLENLREDITSLMLHNKRMYNAILAYATDVAAASGDVIMDGYAAASRVLTRLGLGILNTKTAGGIEEPTINLYLELNASTELDRAFPTFVDAARGVCFDTAMTGTGRFFPGFICINCRGITHPTGLCPFESEPEWMAITRPDRDERTDSSSGSGPPPPPPPPPASPRNQGPPPRRDTPAPSARLPASSLRNPKGKGPGRP